MVIDTSTRSEGGQVDTDLELSGHKDQNARRSLVTFRLGQQKYALPIEPIERIVEMVAVTPIPQVDHSVEGVINYHGKTVPAVNLRRQKILRELVKSFTPLAINLPAGAGLKSQSTFVLRTDA